MNQPNIAVLIPCLDEGPTIAKVVADFRAALPEARVYVCDNGSGDDTASKALDAGAWVLKEPQRGKGAALRRLLREVEADYYFMVDGDDTHDAEIAKEMLSLLISGKADIVHASRVYTGGAKASLLRRFGNRAITLASNTLFGAHYGDALSGFRAFNRHFAKQFPCLSDGFTVETEMNAFAAREKYRVAEVRCSYRERPEHSKSKLHAVKDGARIFKAIWRFSRREKEK